MIHFVGGGNCSKSRESTGFSRSGWGTVSLFGSSRAKIASSSGYPKLMLKVSVIYNSVLKLSNYNFTDTVLPAVIIAEG